jgi:hypothetical protein
MYATFPFVCDFAMAGIRQALRNRRARKLAREIAEVKGLADSYDKERAALLKEAADHYRTRDMYRAAARDLVARDGEVTCYAVDAYYIAEDAGIWYDACHERAEDAADNHANAMYLLEVLEDELHDLTID